MEDHKIIEQCQAGRTEAFSHLVRRYQSEAIGHSLALLGNLPDALDAVQEAFVSAFQALDRFDKKRRFYPWFYTILRNHCYKELARHKKNVVQDLGMMSVPEAQTDQQSSEQAETVQRALQRLCPRDRELLTLKQVDGLTYNELAERLAIPAGTVMSRLFHARRRFRSLYLKHAQ